ncbi:RagB/SusD family nutrient uptake outer membrane protein [Saccharicrinis sp. GN24d3]|uniref:RagB/SusD family nutrient uptake outer membrane protein n=1 Tax=Saccharicrinis sp. GN24d3 TaxID=3458416 RepID=UPI00403658C6
MMKTKYLILAFIAILGSLITSCSDFLQEDTRAILSPDGFITNQESANLALNGLQGQLTGTADMNQLLGTDQGVVGRNSIAAGWISAVYQHDATHPTVLKSWSTNYTAVKDANFLLSSIEGADVTDEIRGSTKAQALFYRAIFYWNLSTTFGDVPYWRNELDIEAVSMLGKTDAEVIQQDMIDDLQEAIESGYLSTDTWQGNGGRPTVWAARMLKAHFHIWLKQWSEARTELKEVIEKSPHGSTLGDFGDTYREGSETHNEIIFGREFIANVQNNASLNVFHYQAANENPNAKKAMAEVDVFTNSAAMTLRKSFADTYDENDARKKYTVWENYTLSSGTEAVFNWIYIPKFMRCTLPIEDPLMTTPEAKSKSSDSYKLFKLSEAYLLLSEAEFMIGGSSIEALAALNAVRTRANLTSLTVMTIEDIYRERAWELAAEGFIGRKRDLIRWGIFESTIYATPQAERAAGATESAIERAMDDSTYITNGADGKYYYYPIPTEELLKAEDIGSALTQNPLWE